MPRRPLKPRQRRGAPLPDPVYNSAVITRFLNKLNFRGKKTVAENIIRDAFELMKEKTKEDPLKVFLQAIENARPLVEVKPRRIGGATYQVPVEVTKFRGESLAMRWILQYAREKKGMPASQKIGEEMVAAYKNEGASIKKKEDTHKMAEANKAFAHYRW